MLTLHGDWKRGRWQNDSHAKVAITCECGVEVLVDIDGIATCDCGRCIETLLLMRTIEAKEAPE